MDLIDSKINGKNVVCFTFSVTRCSSPSSPSKHPFVVVNEFQV